MFDFTIGIIVLMVRVKLCRYAKLQYLHPDVWEKFKKRKLNTHDPGKFVRDMQ